MIELNVTCERCGHLSVVSLPDAAHPPQTIYAVCPVCGKTIIAESAEDAPWPAFLYMGEDLIGTLEFLPEDNSFWLMQNNHQPERLALPPGNEDVYSICRTVFDELFDSDQTIPIPSSSQQPPELPGGPAESFYASVASVLRISDNQIRIDCQVNGCARTGMKAVLFNLSSPDSAPVETTILEVDAKNLQGRTYVLNETASLLLSFESESFSVRVGTVLFTGRPDPDKLHAAYVDTLASVYLPNEVLTLTSFELSKLPLQDLEELLQLIGEALRDHLHSPKTDLIQDLRNSQKQVRAALVDKLMSADLLYVLWNKKTGEPHLLSKVIPREKGTFSGSAPSIIIVPPSQLLSAERSLHEDNLEFRPIGGQFRPINEFLPALFDTTGALLVRVVLDYAVLTREDFTPYLKTSTAPTNPELACFMLLLGQQKFTSESNTEDQRIHGFLYLLFMRSLSDAKLLAPIHKLPESTTGEKAKPAYMTVSGKEGKTAVRLYTDLAHLHRALGKGTDYISVKVEDLIDQYDCILNLGDVPAASRYMTKDLFYEFKFAISRSKETAAKHTPIESKPMISKPVKPVLEKSNASSAEQNKDKQTERDENPRHIFTKKRRVAALFMVFFLLVGLLARYLPLLLSRRNTADLSPVVKAASSVDEFLQPYQDIQPSVDWTSPLTLAGEERTLPFHLTDLDSGWHFTDPPGDLEAGTSSRFIELMSEANNARLSVILKNDSEETLPASSCVVTGVLVRADECPDEPSIFSLSGGITPSSSVDNILQILGSPYNTAGSTDSFLTLMYTAEDKVLLIQTEGGSKITGMTICLRSALTE